MANVSKTLIEELAIAQIFKPPPQVNVVVKQYNITESFPDAGGRMSVELDIYVPPGMGSYQGTIDNVLKGINDAVDPERQDRMKRLEDELAFWKRKAEDLMVRPEPITEEVLKPRRIKMEE